MLGGGKEQAAAHLVRIEGLILLVDILSSELNF